MPAARSLVLLLSVAWTAGRSVWGVDPSQLPPPANRSVDFAREIRPIFAEHCHSCHGSEKQKSGLRLDLKVFALRGGDEGVAIIPGHSAESPLIHYVAHLVPDKSMPPKGQPLDPVQIGLLRAWIDQGALWDVAADEDTPEDPLRWWSLRPLNDTPPPSRPEPPDSWRANPIDRHVFAGLVAKQLRPSPPADRRTLIRRVTYDLLGLPPSPSEVEAFVGDPSPQAYADLVDRLLASPHYGERWGRHWLDVIRFGESRGFERNEIIRTAWPFRDYVIRSFNDDKPFDRFVLEQLAGDVLGPGDPDVEVGTGFLVAGPYDDVGNQDPVQARLIRNNTLDEIIAGTSGAFLGLTVQCARCHDHKFDPISTRDYYRFSAVFGGVYHGERLLATPPQRQQREETLKPLEARRADLEKALRDFESAILERAPTNTTRGTLAPLPAPHPHLTEDRFPPTEARFVRLTIQSNNRDPRDAANVRLDELEVWSDGPASRNVALVTEGATIDAPTRRAEDFAEAYAPDLMIDGVYGARWVSPGAGPITVTLPRLERISRVAFSADRLQALPAESGEIVFVGEYRIELSRDGAQWHEVANSRDRVPINEAFGRDRRLQAALTADELETRSRLRRDLAEARAAIAAVPTLPQVWAGRFEPSKGPFHVLKGGDSERPGAEVTPASLSTLARVAGGFELPADSPESERRLALARWIVQPDNPLTPRVLANRVWHYHFGKGLVDTPSDFGKLGNPPTHPELLDWLARRLLQHGWRIKPLHRDILLSETYRQSSAWNAEAAGVDADARFLWRFPPQRLDAEEVRDSMLQVAGVLDRRPGGPGFQLYRYLQDNVATYVPLDQHGPETYRRAVYHHNARATVVDLMTEFDLPDCAFATPRRARTTSPLQALTLLNHSFTRDMAAAFASRIERAAGTADSSGQVREAFRLAFGRSVTPQELADATTLVHRRGLPALGRVLFNSNEFLYVE